MINCIIIDDEPLARKGLKEYIADVDFLKLVGEFENALKATEILSTGETQLIFLDIQMPKITGLDFLKSIRHAPPVIFTTAFPQHALEGFELNALDYLVKPFSFERFLNATLRAKEYYEIREHNKKNQSVPVSDPNHFYIKAENKLVKILFEDIIFAEALQNYVVIHAKEKKYISYLTFKSVEEYLPTTRFIKVHKSFIIAAGKIDSIDGNIIRIGQHQIPISRNLKEEVMEKILNGKFLKR